MFELNEKIRDLTPYDPITGTYTVRLDANESFLSLPDDVRQELGQIASSLDYRRYPDPLAKDVCAAFGAYYGGGPGVRRRGQRQRRTHQHFDERIFAARGRGDHRPARFFHVRLLCAFGRRAGGIRPKRR